MRSRRIELARIGICQAAYIASVLDASRLHPQTNSKVRNLPLPRIANRNQHPLDTTLTKTAGHQDPVVIRELFLVSSISSFQPFRFDPVQVELQVMRQSPMNQSLFQRLVA